ncbi:MAG: 30S ribosomal protein S12 methylthiotransferase RimO [Deltaproteobacteria bacterium]|nr:30S ribosomal protein S12 methylthiotransferase RimO [Deltaproteobacteria bacterium]
MAKVHFVSLGCPKNRVDAEHMLGITLAGGHIAVEDPAAADAIVVNTCSFIGEAKKESIEAVLEMGALKGATGAKLIVSGCMAQRYAGELERELPEVDAFLGTSDYARIEDVLAGFGLSSTKKAKRGLPIIDGGAVAAPASAPHAHAHAHAHDHGHGHGHGPDHDHEHAGARNQVTDDLTYVAGCDLPRKNSMPRYTAYLKIAEGCDNACAFCIIPALRGKQRSRPIDDLVREARRLVDEGVVEISLIAQDLTGYGHDLPGRPTLAQLLDELAGVPGLRWVRCQYMYPRTLSDHLLSVMDTSANTLPYFDIPTQHGSDRMLLRMKRGKDQKKLGALLSGVRDKVRHAVLRSTVIVGFPGEHDDDFEQLLAFADQVRFERLGVFKYSDEEGTAAFNLDGKLPYAIKRKRYDKLMRRQRRIHEDNNRRLVGTLHEAIVEGAAEDHEWVLKGRLWSQAPEIDGITYFNTTRELRPGQVVVVEVTDVKDYDVVATVLEDDDPRLVEAAPFAARARVARGAAE